MKVLLISLLLIFSSSVSFGATPSDSDLEQLFNKNRTLFIKLKDLIYSDLAKEDMLQVGKNVHIKPNISNQKLESYISELEKISVQRLTAYRSTATNIETSFLVSSTGFVFGGCSSEIVHHQEGSPFIREWAEPYKIMELKGGWYAYTLCN